MALGVNLETTWDGLVAGRSGIRRVSECPAGGFQLALSCDMRIAERRSVFCFDEVKLGFLPGMATFRLAKYMGFGRAKSIILTGRKVRAEEALSWGILDRLCDQVSFEEGLAGTVNDLLPFHPVLLEMARRLLDESYGTSYENFLGHFLAAQYRAINSEAFDRLVVRAARQERRSELGRIGTARRRARGK